jgi:Na+/melibiose symporter-like transporter
MTQAEFMRQLSTLHRRVRAVFLGGGALVIAFNLAIYAYLFHAYPLSSLSRDSHDAGIYYAIGTVLSLVAVIALLVALTQTRRRYTPRCPACGASATALDAPQALAAGKCKQCLENFWVP